jgi:dolichyl-phosphate-mannose--protein O-mannosyl transferase
MKTPQTFENHAKFVPGYHIVVFGIFVINLLWSIYRLIHALSAESVISLLLAIAFLLLFFYARIFALTVQDRVIRLEMQLRLHQCLPAELRSRIPEFEVAQLIALRFASDQELPELARKVLNERIQDRKAIKKMVKNWNSDFLRA